VEGLEISGKVAWWEPAGAANLMAHPTWEWGGREAIAPGTNRGELVKDGRISLKKA